jgi:hypothetical protein
MDHREPSMDHREPSMDHREPPRDHREATARIVRPAANGAVEYASVRVT